MLANLAGTKKPNVLLKLLLSRTKNALESAYDFQSFFWMPLSLRLPIAIRSFSLTVKFFPPRVALG